MTENMKLSAEEIAMILGRELFAKIIDAETKKRHGSSLMERLDVVRTDLTRRSLSGEKFGHIDQNAMYSMALGVECVVEWFLKNRKNYRVISVTQHDHLISRNATLSALEDAGVDNWQGYEHAMSASNEEDEV